MSNSKVNMLKNLMMMASVMLDRNGHIQKLKESIDEYLLVPTEENFKHIEIHCSLLMMSEMNQGSMEKMMENTDRMDQIMERDRLFKTGDN